MSTLFFLLVATDLLSGRVESSFSWLAGVIVKVTHGSNI